MGKAKQNEAKTYELTEHEWSYIKILSTTLVYHVLRDKIISGFLYHIAHSRLNYSAELNLQFEIDLDGEKQEIKITEIPAEA
jgi:hypothetical protein